MAKIIKSARSKLGIKLNSNFSISIIVIESGHLQLNLNLHPVIHKQTQTGKMESFFSVNPYLIFIMNYLNWSWGGTRLSQFGP